jgi:uncharacterized protein (TIGR02271 family)
MIKQNQAQQLLDGGHVVGSDGENIGKIGQVYLDNETGDVTWVTVKTGWFGANESFVPTDAATVTGDTVTVPYDKATIKDAPHSSDAGEALSPEQENDLYRYYGVSGYDTDYTDTTSTVNTAVDTTVGTAATTAAATDTVTGAGEYITRSEEQLRVGTTTREAGRARLRKFVVTEQQTVTVPVSHEEVRVVREPIAAGDDLTGVQIGDQTLEVTLHQDEVVVQKDVVGVEKIRLATELVTEQQQVTEQVRKEQIEIGDVVPTTDTTRNQI